MKKFLHLVLTVIFSVTMMMPGFALAAGGTGLSANQKLDRIEDMLYGSNQGGSLIQRMDNVETDVFGEATGDPVLSRIARTYEYLMGVPTSGEASFTTKLNMVEWHLKQSMSGECARARIEDLESMLNGTPSAGAFALRLDSLLKLTAYGDGVVPVQVVTLPKDKLLKIQFTKEFSSRDNAVGDEISFKSMEDLYDESDVFLVVPKGATGVGKIKKIRKPSAFGRDARIDIDFLYIHALDGTKVPIYVGPLAEQEAKTIAAGVGASVGGILILGPVGVVGGAFVKGKQVTVKAGTVTVVQTARNTEIQGAMYQGKE